MVREGSLVCTLNSLAWGNNCNKCSTWRLVVWKDGAHEYEAGSNNYDGVQLSTKVGNYYGGHEICAHGDNFPLCGEWGYSSGKYKVI